MPTLIIDGQTITVPDNTFIIDAAERLGIMIPRFCYHKALGSVAACRMCAVMLVEGPVKGLKMSCATKALEGMVVETDHPEAVAFRRQIIEWLMLNHPHDCPVCDEGGQCLLQDETISGNHCLRASAAPKRTYHDQYIGPFVQHEMNRCIHCYRCSRFYQEYAGGRDFGPMQNANRVYFGRFSDGPLESAFSGNLVDICPTGVFTDKSARFRARRWDLERAPSVCPHCSLGCNTVVNARYREVVRVEARFSEGVNGYFLCDRGRYSHGFAHLEQRPRQARMDGQAASINEAVSRAAVLLAQTAARHGGQAVACLGSARSCLESLGELARVAKAAEYRSPAHFADPAARRAVRGAVNALTESNARSRSELERADAILCLGLDPLAEAPMLALALRQATRRTQHPGLVVLADPRPVSLPLPFTHLPIAVADLPACLDLLAGLVADPAGDAAASCRAHLPGYPALWARIEAAAKALGACKNPVIACGTALVPAELPGLAGDAAGRIASAKNGCGLFFALPGANAFGAALLEADDAPSIEDVLVGIEQGTVKAVLAMECDPFALGAAGPGFGRARLDAALARLEAVVVLDHLPTPLAAAADVFLPVTVLFESGGTLVNNEGRLQLAAPAYAPGLPVSQDGHGDHPPRDYDHGHPGAAPQPAWQVLAEILAAANGPHPPADLWTAVAGSAPGLGHLAPGDYPFDNVRVFPPQAATPPAGEGGRAARAATMASQAGGMTAPQMEAAPKARAATAHAGTATQEPGMTAPQVETAAPQATPAKTASPPGAVDPALSECVRPALAPESPASADAALLAPAIAPGKLMALYAERFLGTEELGGYSAFLRRVTPAPHACLRTDAGLALGLADGDRAVVDLGGDGNKTFEIAVRLFPRMAGGVLILPRHPDFMPDGRSDLHVAGGLGEQGGQGEQGEQGLEVLSIRPVAAAAPTTPDASTAPTAPTGGVAS